MADLDTPWAQMLIKYRNRVGMTSRAMLAEATGVTLGYITRMETEQMAPPEEFRLRLVKALKLTKEEAETFHLRAELERLDPMALKYLRKLNENTPRAVAKGLKPWPKGFGDELVEERRVLYKIPIINKASAGLPQDFTDLDYPAGVADKYIAVPDVKDPNAFAFYADGDSMEPDFPDGTLLIASPNSVPVNGAPCFVRFSPTAKLTGCTFKRVYVMSDGQVRIVPINRKYAETRVSPEDLAAVWPVVRWYAREEPADTK